MEITKEMFERIPKNREDAELIVRPSISFWQDVWRRLKKKPVAMSSLVLLAVLVFMVIFGPYFTKFEYNRIDSSGYKAELHVLVRYRQCGQGYFYPRLDGWAGLA